MKASIDYIHKLNYNKNHDSLFLELVFWSKYFFQIDRLRVLTFEVFLWIIILWPNTKKLLL